MIVDRYRPQDLAAVYRICLATGPAEEAAGVRKDPNLLGHLYVGPYVSLEPEHAFVLREGAEVLGYAIGARDTAAFEDRCEAHWWPPLRAMYPLEVERPEADARRVRRLYHPSRSDRHLLQAYPSHLHIDLLEAAQGHGYGRLLLEQLLRSLFEAGSAGVHLGVGIRNERAIGFYRHLGFRRLKADEASLVMGRRAP